MKNHSRHTPFRMCVVALFFVLAWWRVFMTNSLPAKTARKLQANRNFWKTAAILKPLRRELGWFQPRFEELWTLTGDKAWCEAKTKLNIGVNPVTFVSGRQDGWNSTLHFVDENVYILRRGQDRRQERISLRKHPFLLALRRWGRFAYPFMGLNRASLGSLPAAGLLIFHILVSWIFQDIPYGQRT